MASTVPVDTIVTDDNDLNTSMVNAARAAVQGLVNDASRGTEVHTVYFDPDVYNDHALKAAVAKVRENKWPETVSVLCCKTPGVEGECTVIAVRGSIIAPHEDTATLNRWADDTMPSVIKTLKEGIRSVCLPIEPVIDASEGHILDAVQKRLQGTDIVCSFLYHQPPVLVFWEW